MLFYRFTKLPEEKPCNSQRKEGPRSRRIWSKNRRRPPGSAPATARSRLQSAASADFSSFKLPSKLQRGLSLSNLLMERHGSASAPKTKSTQYVHLHDQRLTSCAPDLSFLGRQISFAQSHGELSVICVDFARRRNQFSGLPQPRLCIDFVSPIHLLRTYM